MPIKLSVFRLVVWQFIIVMGLALALFFIRGAQSGFSAFLGGLAYWLPTTLVSFRLFKNPTASGAMRFVMALFAGETAKLFLSAVLFVVIVNYLPVELLSVFVGFLASILGFVAILAIWVFKDSPRAPR